jgi:hypothetical protein
MRSMAAWNWRCALPVASSGAASATGKARVALLRGQLLFETAAVQSSRQHRARRTRIRGTISCVCRGNQGLERGDACARRRMTLPASGKSIPPAVPRYIPCGSFVVRLNRQSRSSTIATSPNSFTLLSISCSILTADPCLGLSRPCTPLWPCVGLYTIGDKIGMADHVSQQEMQPSTWRDVHHLHFIDSRLRRAPLNSSRSPDPPPPIPFSCRFT